MKAHTNNNLIDIEEVNWQYIPNIFQISTYLPQNDLIQLSLSCKKFRCKLNPIIFRKIELIKGGEIIPGKPNKSSKKKQLEIVMDILEEDYSDKYHFVEHCILWEYCNNSFVVRFFNLFTNITKLELYYGKNNINSSNTNPVSYNNLIFILKPLIKLEYLVMDCKLINCLEASNLSNFKLSTCLKALDVVEYSSDSLDFHPIENINGEYSALNQVTIINNKMLANMITLMKSLTKVTLFNYQYLCPKLLAEFFCLNPQLIEISIPYNLIETDVINSMLKMNQLEHLSITQSTETLTNQLYNLVTNTSVRHLNIKCNITENILIPILQNLKSLHTLEFSEFDFWNFSDISWHSYSGKIPIFHLNGIWNANSNVDEFVNPAIIDKIRFSNMFELDYYFMYYGFEELDNWKVIQDDPLNSREFWLVKKDEEELNKKN